MGLKPAWEVNSPQKFNAFPISHFQPCYIHFYPSALPQKAQAWQDGGAICRLVFVGTSRPTNDSALGQEVRSYRGKEFSHVREEQSQGQHQIFLLAFHPTVVLHLRTLYFLCFLSLGGESEISPVLSSV